MSAAIDKLWESKKRLEQINSRLAARNKEEAPEKRLKFEERNRRITIYLENAVFDELQAIRSQGVNQSMVVNLAVREFLEKNWTAPESQ